MWNRRVIATSAIMMLFIISFASASSETPLTRDFFINPYDGTSNCMIVIGEGAAASDVMSAAWLATQIGAMAYYEESEETIVNNEMTYYSNDNIYNKQESDTGTGQEDDGAFMDTESLGGGISNAVLPYGEEGKPYWDYDVYVDPYSEFDNSDNWMRDTGYSIETISIDFSIGNYLIEDGGVTGSGPSISQKYASVETFLLNENQVYPTIFPRQYWAPVLETGTAIDPLGGMEYRSIAYGMEEPTAANETEGQMVDVKLNYVYRSGLVEDLYTSSGQVFFLGNTYQCLDFGTDGAGYDYMLYGEPHWSRIELEAGDTYLIGGGWTLDVRKIDIYNEIITILITNPSGSSKSFDISKSSSLSIQDALLPGVFSTIFSIAPENISIKKDLSVSCAIYTLKDYGVIKETIYGLNRPYVKNDELEWHLDIMPCDDVQDKDLDNALALLEGHNPSYCSSDRLSVYTTLLDGGMCVPYLELWLATPIECDDDGQCTISLTLGDEQEYFHVDISDRYGGDLKIDDYIKIGRTTKNMLIERNYIDIDSSQLAVRDSQVTVSVKSDYNLILVGGPVANAVVGELIVLGVTTLDFWTRSYGDMVIYKDAFVLGKDVIVVAGRDREATNKATKSLLNLMTNL